MGYDIIIVGENIKDNVIEELDEDRTLYTEKICVTSLNNKEVAKSLVKKINSEGKYKAYTSEEYNSLLKYQEKSYIPLENMTYEDLFSLQFTGDDHFVVYNDGVLSTWSLKSSFLEEIKNRNIRGNIIVSNTGIFVINYFGSEVRIFSACSLELFNDYFLDSEIVKIQFSPKDSFVIVHTKSQTYLINVFLGMVMYKCDRSPAIFSLDEKYCIFYVLKKMFNFCDSKEEDIFEEYKNIKKIAMKNDQVVIFTEDKVQRISYVSKKGSNKKTQGNIKTIDFKFSKNRVFCVIQKKIKDKDIFNIESYSHDTVTTNPIETEITKIEVSDSSFITFNKNKEIDFYVKEKFSFVKTKKILKDEDVIISIADKLACIYDTDTENIEFYDKGELRSVYSHQSCDSIKWSTNELYLASISYSCGSIQIYNNNGKLLFKKIYSVLYDFIWLSFIFLEEEEKKQIDNYNISEFVTEDDTNNDQNVNLDELISDWKSFLISKKQLLQQCQKFN